MRPYDSASGGVFGYQIGPRLRGLGDAAAGNVTAEVVGTLLVTLDVSGLDPIVLKLPFDPLRANIPGLPTNRTVFAPVIKVVAQ